MNLQLARLTILIFGFSLIWGCTSTPEYPASDAAQTGDDAGPTSDATADGNSEPDAGPCGGGCVAPTPVCEESSGECVACVGDDDCTDGVCADDNTCVACLGDGDCDEGVCDTDANACVECVDDAQCDGETPACDVDNNECVQCVEHAQCAEVGASACGDDNTCQACAASEECGHLDDTPACDIDAGECVECTVDDESACNGNSCDPATNTCTDTPTDSVDTCGTCRADSECAGDMRCVPLDFDGQRLDDGYCLEVRPDGGTCEGPWGTVINRMSLSGEYGDFCGINEDLTTCQAVLDQQSGKSCGGNAADCGMTGKDDGSCPIDSCTYQCDANDECENDCVGLTSKTCEV